MNAPVTEVEVVKAAVRDAADRLASGGGNREEGLLYVGQLHGTYPDALLEQPLLTDSAKVQYLFLSREAVLGGRGAIAMPTVTETAERLGQSPKTVSRDRLLLRLARWISLAEEVRDSSGRWRGVVYAVHDRAANLDVVLAIDAGYMQRLESALDHADPHVRRAARDITEAIEGVIAAGLDPLEVDLAAWQKTCTERAKGGVHSVDSPRPPESGESYPQKVFDSETEPPCVKFTRGDADPHVNFTCGNQPTDIQDKSPSEEGSGAPHVKFTHGHPRSSSSSRYIKTTTTTSTEAEKNTRAETLRWPEELDDNQRRVVRRVLAQHAPPGLEQQLLDALALKMRDTIDPLRSPPGYLYRLCERARRGAFVPPVVSTDERTDAEEARRRQAADLTAELHGLERLRDAASGAAREALDGQIRTLRERLAQVHGRPS